VPLYGIREDLGRGAHVRTEALGVTTNPSIVIEGCAVAAVDAAGTEMDDATIVIDGQRIVSIGPGRTNAAGGRRINGRGMLATPGLVNCHHHLFQWLTRGRAQQANLFEWLVELYPVWAHIDADMVRVAARAGLIALARSGCSTSADHHYVFPPDAGDPLAAEIDAAVEVGLRFHPGRGSMDLGQSDGGLPPDEVTEDKDAILSSTQEAITRWHDSSPESMLRIAVAPCSPFSATEALMRESADLARSMGVRLHTHMAETIEEEDYCLEKFGMRPVEFIEELGWLEDDVWLAHCVHLSSDEVARFGSALTGVAHCPSSNARLGAGIAPVADLVRSSAPVGLGVDGAASNEAGELNLELKAALLAARVRGGAAAMTARDALTLGTMGGARCLGRAHDIGSLEEGKLADIALWNLDELGYAGIEDAVAALVFGPPRSVHTLVVNGRVVVDDNEVLTSDELDAARDLEKASARLAERVET
jgi:cytosine/adenosine deaminase-related metal-dependent hydrolase